MSEEIRNEEVVENEQVEPEVNENPTAEEPEKTPDEKKFTQAEIDKILAKRLKREKENQSEIVEKLKRLEEFEKAEEEREKAALSETERLLAEKEEAQQLAAEREEAANKAFEAANQRILNTEIRAVARSLDANDLNDVLTLLDKSAIEVDDNGEVKGVEEAVKALKESKPWMFKKAIGADAIGGGNPNKNPSVSELDAKEKELADLKEQAAKNPRLIGKVTKLYNEILSLKSKK
jgi:hypothetical protein